ARVPSTASTRRSSSTRPCWTSSINPIPQFNKSVLHLVLDSALSLVLEIQKQQTRLWSNAHTTHEWHLRSRAAWGQRSVESTWPYLSQWPPRYKASCARQMDGCNASLPARRCTSNDPVWGARRT